MPAYWVGLLLMWGIGVQLNWLPTNGNGTWRHLILPSFTVALSYISTYIRLIRNNMLENMKQDYVLYANVRGLPQKAFVALVETISLLRILPVSVSWILNCAE